MSTRPLKPEDVRLIVIHCSATSPKQDIGLAEIDRWHRQRGMLRVGYHRIIRRDGTIENGRSLNEPGAHAAGFNRQSIGVCLVGGVDVRNKPEDNFTPEQWAALKTLCGSLVTMMFPKARIVGHRDLSPDMNGDGVVDFSEWKKACPSFDVAKWLSKTFPGGIPC